MGKRARQTTAHEMVGKKAVHELEIKFGVGQSFEAAADREAFLRRFTQLHELRAKSKRVLICDTPDLAITDAGFDLVLNGRVGVPDRPDKIKQRLKTHAKPDAQGVRERFEHVAKLSPEGTVIVPPLTALHGKAADGLAHINPEHIRAIGQIEYEKHTVCMQMRENDPESLIEISADYVVIRPLFEAPRVEPVMISEAELDTERGDRDLLLEVAALMQAAAPALKVSSVGSKSQQALRAWGREAIRNAADCLPKPNTELYVPSSEPVMA